MSRKGEEHNGKHVVDTIMSKLTAISPEAAVGMTQTVSGQNTRLSSHQSKSAPPTPDPRPYVEKHQQSSVIGNRGHDGSPRSLKSESSHTVLTVTRPQRYCKFETGMAQARRRVPYALGPEKLEDEPTEENRTLGEAENVVLTKTIRELYEHLTPSSESEDRRAKFVHKLGDLLQTRWPGARTNVNVFGSTGNCLGSSESDVDICITTNCREIENVCLIAELLESIGMQRIVCVSSAKIPIVKAWDPEFQVACDINVNNPIALENTHMIRSYVAIDERVRPLAMAVKYWAKRRMLNDAALGGTLSSYTWICMVLSFLQTRSPPILPALQQKSGLKPVVLNGVNVAFDKDIASYKDYGEQNTLSLGELLFQFFRYYAHEFDYEHDALSVRLGRVIPKSQKAWHLLQDNRLCVEEPFNTTRNLANTADDTSMRGIHLDLRRAFKLVAAGDLLTCCEEYVPSPEERRQTATFIHPTARPIIPQPPHQQQSHNSRSNRNSYRGNRNSRNSASRRASNPTTRNPNYLHDLPFQMTPQELQLQAQHQQHLLHDQLFQHYQYLQLQEQELRMQLYQQSMRQRGFLPQQSYTSTTENGLRFPMSPTMYQNRFGGNPPYPHTTSPSSGIVTNPGSPSLSNVIPDGRRAARRTSLATSAPATSPRARSQPGRSVPMSSILSQMRTRQESLTDQHSTPDDRSSVTSNTAPSHRPYLQYRSESGTLYDVGRRPAEFMGYYVGRSPSLAAHNQSATISPIPSHAGLAIHYGGFSPQLSLQSSRIVSRNNSPNLQHTSLVNHYGMNANGTLSEHSKSPPTRDNLLLFNETITSPKRIQATQHNGVITEALPISASTSEDMGIDTPSTSEDQFHESVEQSRLSLANFYESRHLTTEFNQINSPNTEHVRDGDHAYQHNGIGIVLDTPTSEQESGRQTPMSSARSPTHNQGKQNNEVNSVNGTNGKKKKNKAEKPISAESNANNTMQQILTPRTNGQESLPRSETVPKAAVTSSAWQPIQKKKKKPKKVNKSEGDSATLNKAGGELRPLDVSLQKGG